MKIVYVCSGCGHKYINDAVCPIPGCGDTRTKMLVKTTTGARPANGLEVQAFRDAFPSPSPKTSQSKGAGGK